MNTDPSEGRIPEQMIHFLVSCLPFPLFFSPALRQIPIVKFQPGDPYETCVICLDDFVEGEKLRVLPCNHGYHQKCIDPWLLKVKRAK